jgi:hypothetical protein
MDDENYAELMSVLASFYGETLDDKSEPGYGGFISMRKSPDQSVEEFFASRIDSESGRFEFAQGCGDDDFSTTSYDADSELMQRVAMILPSFLPSIPGYGVDASRLGDMMTSIHGSDAWATLKSSYTL